MVQKPWKILNIPRNFELTFLIVPKTVLKLKLLLANWKVLMVIPRDGKIPILYYQWAHISSIQTPMYVGSSFWSEWHATYSFRKFFDKVAKNGKYAIIIERNLFTFVFFVCVPISKGNVNSIGFCLNDDTKISYCYPWLKFS